jgi:HK97 family phage portal protein
LTLLSKLSGLLSSRKGSASQPKQGLLTAGQPYWWGSGSWLNGIFGGDTPSAGISFTDEQALSVTAIYACSRAIAENLASLPGLVYAQQIRQRNLDRGSVPWQLLHDEPNHEMDSMTFWELSVTRLENRGNAFAEIQRNNRDEPIALWPIHNSRVEPHRDKEGRIEWRISTDQYDPRVEQFRWYSIPDRDMLNIVGFGGNGYLAPGTIPCGQEQISFSMATHRYGSSFFKQGGRPLGVVEMPGFIDDPDARQEFRADINNLHSGVENWNKTAVLWNGGKWKEMQYSPEQVMFIASQQFSDKRICQMYRVPPAIVQIFDDYKFSSVDAMLQSFVMTCLRPVAIRMERGVNRKLMHYRDGRGRLVDAFDGPKIFEFLLEAMLRGDAKKQAETLEIKRRNGILNSNEWRALDNDPPLPGDQGEHYILPGGFVRLDQMNQQAVPAVQPATQPANPPATAQFDAHTKLPGSNLSFVEALESVIGASGRSSRGGSANDVESVYSELAEEVLLEAVGRVESVAKSELLRVAKISDAAVRSAKQQELKDKHRGRLESAIVPAAKIYARLDAYEGQELGQIVSQLADEQMGRIAWFD